MGLCRRARSFALARAHYAPFMSGHDLKTFSSLTCGEGCRKGKVTEAASGSHLISTFTTCFAHARVKSETRKFLLINIVRSRASLPHDFIGRLPHPRSTFSICAFAFAAHSRYRLASLNSRPATTTARCG